MKRLIKSYTSFTRPERNGLIALCLLLAVTITLKALTREHNTPQEPERLLATYRQQNEAFLKASPKRKQKETISKSQLPIINQKSPITNLKSFDPNTVDSATLRSFGLRPITISNLMKWRAKGKRFYRKEDIRPLYTLTTEEYNMLAPYIDIKRQQIDLNRADSITLLKLRGIGPKLAHKILIRRSTIGPFTHHGQLKELYHFPDGVYERLVEELKPLSEPQINRD